MIALGTASIQTPHNQLLPIRTTASTNSNDPATDSLMCPINSKDTSLPTITMKRTKSDEDGSGPNKQRKKTKARSPSSSRTTSRIAQTGKVAATGLVQQFPSSSIPSTIQPTLGLDDHEARRLEALRRFSQTNSSGSNGFGSFPLRVPASMAMNTSDRSNGSSNSTDAMYGSVNLPSGIASSSMNHLYQAMSLSAPVAVADRSFTNHAAGRFLPQHHASNEMLLLRQQQQQRQLALSRAATFGSDHQARGAVPGDHLQQRQALNQLLQSTISSDGQNLRSRPMSLDEEILRHRLAQSGDASQIQWNSSTAPLSSLLATASGSGPMSSSMAGNVSIDGLRAMLLQQQQQQQGSPSLRSSSLLENQHSALPSMSTLGAGVGRFPFAAALYGQTGTTSTNTAHQALLQQLALSELQTRNDTTTALPQTTSRMPGRDSLLSSNGQSLFDRYDMQGSQMKRETGTKISKPSVAGRKNKARGSRQGEDLSKKLSSSAPFVPTTMHFKKNEKLIFRLPFPKSPPESIPHYRERQFVPLATDEDQNWLSDLLCFVRSELVEVFRATDKDVRQRNSSKRVRLGQVGLRCRFCAHISQGARVGRSSSFPSSLDRIYQSLTMMLRDHFPRCTIMPKAHLDRFMELKRRTTQGATDSKQYWVHAAREMGLEDTDNGIWVCQPVDSANVSSTPYSYEIGAGQSKDSALRNENGAKISAQSSANDDIGDESSTSSVGEAVSNDIVSTNLKLVVPEDKTLMSPLLYIVLSNVQLVHMEKSEQTGNRKSLPVGLPGLACIHCCQSGRRGLCRIFPSRRRTLTQKMEDLYQHFVKCNLCPPHVKQQLVSLREAPVDNATANHDAKKDRGFVETLWMRMHGNSQVEDQDC
mmetsp:Transcript_41879/g.100546  ORF Transcript_41879/g.100546 Transcript_41879/m.100546 type:complete len:872 (-) Transcript_41879:60-2675(-)